MRDAFICDGIRTPIGRYARAGPWPACALTTWPLSRCASC